MCLEGLQMGREGGFVPTPAATNVSLCPSWSMLCPHYLRGTGDVWGMGRREQRHRLGRSSCQTGAFRVFLGNRNESPKEPCGKWVVRNDFPEKVG